jgi:hypothetical protein
VLVNKYNLPILKNRLDEVLLKTFFILAAFALDAVAAEVPPVKLMADMAGVYKHRFKNGIIASGKAPMEADTPYESEDIVEIVPYNDTHIYIRAELQFYNGHSCSISGMAGYEQGRFVFHDPEKAYDGGASCTLTISQSKDDVTITDRLSPDGEATCRGYCGARGSLSGVSILKKSRRPIRYMQRIVNSREYQKAIPDLKTYQTNVAKVADSPDAGK